jgi:hypothetical protein
MLVYSAYSQLTMSWEARATSLRSRRPFTKPCARTPMRSRLSITRAAQQLLSKYRAHVAAWRTFMRLWRRHAARRGEMHELFKAIANDQRGRTCRLMQP